MNKVEQLKRIRKVIQHKEISLLSLYSGVHVSVVSLYLKHAGRAVLNVNRVDRILNAWKIIEPNKIRNYD
jgi:hypothetical protein